MVRTSQANAVTNRRNGINRRRPRRYFQFHCTSSGRRLGGYLCTSWCTCLDYDSGARYVFIGDYSGNITVCKLEDGGHVGGAGHGVHYVNTLKGHTGSIQVS